MLKHFTEKTLRRPNGNWVMDFYDDQTNYLGSLEGDVDADGYCNFPGVTPPGFSIDITDANGNQLPSNFYLVVVTTFPALQQNAAQPYGSGGGSGSASGITKIFIERGWNGARWSVGYMPVYGSTSASSLDLYSMIGLVVGGIQESVFGNNAVIESPYAVTPQPFRIRFASDWGQIASDLHDSSVRNFFYFGHGSADYIGTKDINNNLNMANLQLVLQNAPDPLHGVNQHPFRFVFLDGCKTASGDLCKAFGIPKKTITSAEMRNRYGIRPRAFVGWKGFTNLGVTGTLNQTHKEFIQNFFEKWQQVNPNTGYYYTLREAVNAAAINPANGEQFTHLNDDIIIYGCEDLYFYDGN